MDQTLVGIGMILVGSAIIIFSERMARVTAALHRRTLGKNCRELAWIANRIY